MTSVNTNAAALTALRTLQQTNNAMDATQNRISTGYKIGEAKDNAAYWSISTTLKSDNKSLATVKDALGLGAATVDVAYEALNSTKDVLDELSAKITSARQEGIDRTKLQQEIKDLQNQLKSIAGGASFSGENWLSVDSSNNSTYSASKEVVASFSRSASGSISIGTISVDISDVKLFDANANANGILDGQVSLGLGFGGNAASGPAPAKQGLDTAVSTAGFSVGTVKAGEVTLGTWSATGADVNDSLTFNIAVDGGAPAAVRVALTNVATRATFETDLNNAIDAAVGAGRVTATIDPTTNKIKFTSDATGAGSSIAVTSLAAVDGDGVTTSNLGMVPNGGFGTSAAATTGPVNALTATASQDVGDSLKFRFQYDGETYETTVALTNGGVAATAAFATDLKTAIASATKISDGTILGAGKVNVVADITGGAEKLTFSTVGEGPNKNFGILSQTFIDTDNDGTLSTQSHLGAHITAGVVAGSGTSKNIDFTYDATGYDAGDRLQFEVTLYTPDAVTGAPIANKKTVTIASAANVTDMKNNLQSAFDTAYGAGKVTVANPAGNTIRFNTTALGSGAGIAFDNFVSLDGNGAVSSTAGFLTANVSNAGRDAVATATNASALAGSTFSGPMVFDDGDALTFDLAIDGGTATKVTINKATVDAALGGSAGTVSSGTQFATVVNKALQNAGLAAAVTASDVSGNLKLTKATAGDGSLAISNVVNTSGSNTVSVVDIDLTSVAFTSLTTSQQKQAIEAYVNIVDSAAKSVTAAAAKLGSTAKRIDLQKEFAQTLMDTIEKGVGNLVDADMSEESTKLQALQVKQQLGVQALSIANQSAQQLLRLFQ
ncbi:flagellin N-terminal helical domain-containing protein [Antarcticirhabdus aurantiaca]|uniref:Flagellin n=1 Tax=Antarcticirhabdus aurantiaca TaxID=2606717 RepID=A0ACD4NMT4_9HYPH|nr:flagellin [Antarcticirhabdus aurantiaca]WAJ27931.1 flagellin [Jeongeuplla avenae]